MTHWFAGIPSDRAAIPTWAGFVGAPLLWLAHLQVQYMLVPWLCTTHRHWVAHGVALLVLLVAGWCVYLCWREWNRLGGFDPEVNGPPPDGRTRLLSVVGLMSSALFTLLIIATWLPLLFLSPCWA